MQSTPTIANNSDRPISTTQISTSNATSQALRSPVDIDALSSDSDVHPSAQIPNVNESILEAIKNLSIQMNNRMTALEENYARLKNNNNTYSTPIHTNKKKISL